MASWIVNNELYSENVVWLIQVLTRICKIQITKLILFVSEMKILDILSTPQQFERAHPQQIEYFVNI